MNIENIPEKRRGRELTSLADSEIEEIVEDLSKKGLDINLSLPLLDETVSFFQKTFQCQRCGDCCLGVGETCDNGILLMPDEVERLSLVMLLSKRKFKDNFTFTQEGRRLLKYPCPFYHLDSHTCTIYAIRPIVCQTYPLSQWVIKDSLAPFINGTYMIAVNSQCIAARRLAINFVKIQRTALALLRTSPRTEEMEKLSQDAWKLAKVRQKAFGIKNRGYQFGSLGPAAEATGEV